jgi:hypothetical protein
MIPAPLTDPILRATVRRAAFPEEDVFRRMGEISHALGFGFPRIPVYQPGDGFGAFGGDGSMGAEDSHAPHHRSHAPELGIRPACPGAGGEPDR